MLTCLPAPLPALLPARPPTCRHPVWQPEGHLGKLGDFPCYNASKDLVVPLMSSPGKYAQSPMLGAPTRDRRFLGVFKGRIQVGGCSCGRAGRWASSCGRAQLWAGAAVGGQGDALCPQQASCHLPPPAANTPGHLLSPPLRAAQQPTLQQRHTAVPGQLLP